MPDTKPETPRTDAAAIPVAQAVRANSLLPWPVQLDVQYTEAKFVPIEVCAAIESDLTAALAAKEAAFSQGARAVFDALLIRAANNYHGNPNTNALCDEENALIKEWAETALQEVSPDDCAT